MADLLSTDLLEADCGGSISKITSPNATIGGKPIILAGTKVDGKTVTSSNTTMTVGGVAVLTNEDTYSSHVVGTTNHPSGSLSSAATGATV